MKPTLNGSVSCSLLYPGASRVGGQAPSYIRAQVCGKKPRSKFSVPQQEKSFFWKLVVLETVAVGRLFHPDDAVAFALLQLQEVSELHRLHLTGSNRRSHRQESEQRELFYRKAEY